MSTSRDLIFERIAHANRELQNPANLPPAVHWGTDIDDPLERFCFEWERNSGGVIGKNITHETLTSEISSYISAHFADQSIWIASECSFYSDIVKTLPTAITERAPTKQSMGAATLGILECEVLIAETGTICAGWKSTRHRAISLLPPNVLFIAKQSQIVAHHEDALSILAKRATHGWVWIGGPSRTADIEKVLIKGIHGPKRVDLILLSG